MEMGNGFTFISDMQKGLVEALKNILPLAKHRYFVKHTEANWCKSKEGIMKKYLWWCAWSTYEEDFNNQLKKIGEFDEGAAKSLLSYLPVSWCGAFLDTVCESQSEENNLTESFNAWILEARHRPIIKMLEDIRIKIMNMLTDHEAKLTTWKNDYSPHTMKLYNQYLKIAQKCLINSNGCSGFKVTEGIDKHTANLEIKKCNCRQWDLNGIPRPHAIKALMYKKIDPILEINWWYTKDAYLLTYKHRLQPVRGEKSWKVDPSHAMKPPEQVDLAGRPRSKRTRDKNEAINRQGEWSASRKGSFMTCSTADSLDTMLGDVKSTQRERKRGQQLSWMRKEKAAVLPSEEDLFLSAPQRSQGNQAPMSEFVFMPTPFIEPPSRPKTVSKAERRLLARQ